MSKSVITVNGVRYEVEGGGSVSIRNGEIRVGGVSVVSGLSGVVKVEWSGPAAAAVTADGSVEVHGDVGGSIDAGGSVQCGSVGGDVDAGGSVQCGAVSGNIDAGGSVICGGRR